MLLQPQASYPIPEETQRVARAAFPRGSLYMQVADCLGTIYHDMQFRALFPTRGQPAEAPARLALATLLGPVADDPSWQARAGTGFDKARFLVDWDRQIVTCPMGKQSISWLPNTYPRMA